MTIRLAVLALATVFSLGGSAQAEILASAPVYGASPSFGGFVVCRIFNAGLANATLTQRQIINDLNASVPLNSDSCGAVLAPLKYCAYIATVAGNRAHSCRLVATGVDTNIRGVAEVNAPGGGVLNSLPMQ